MPFNLADAPVFGTQWIHSLSGSSARGKLAKFAGLQGLQMKKVVELFGLCYRALLRWCSNQKLQRWFLLISYSSKVFISRKGTVYLKSSEEYINTPFLGHQSKQHLGFIKSKRSGKWWLEVPSQDESDWSYEYVPLQLSADYQTAQKGEKFLKRWQCTDQNVNEVSLKQQLP